MISSPADSLAQGSVATGVPVVVITGLLVAALAVFVILLAMANRRLSSRHATLNQQVADQSEELRQSQERFKQEVRTDELTGLANRRGLQDQFEHFVAWSVRQERPFAVLMLGIDHFDDFQRDHEAAHCDQVLVKVAGILRQVARRGTDILGRTGPAEFVAVLSDIDPQDAALITGSLHHRLRMAEIEHRTSSVNDFLTVSVGLMVVPNTKVVPDDSLDAAEGLLAHARASGHNTTVMGGPGQPLSSLKPE